MTAARRVGARVLAASALLLPAVAVFAANGITVLLFLCAVAALPLQRRWRPAAGHLPMLALLAALVAWGALSALWSLAPGSSLEAAGRIFMVGVAAWLVWQAAGDVDAPVGRWLLAGFLLAAVLLAIELWFRSPIRALVQERPGGPELVLTWWVNRGVSVMTLLTWPALIAAWRWRGRPAAAAVIVVGGILVVLGPQRTALLAGSAGAAVFILFMWLRTRFAYVLAAALAAAVLAAPVLPRWLPDPVALHETRPDIDFSLIHRLHIWRFAADRIAERPIVGWGLRASRHVPGGDVIVPGAPGPAPYMSLHPHSGPLQLWLELGLVGAAIGAGLLAALALAIKQFSPDRVAIAAAGAALASGFVFAALSYGLWQTWWLATLAMMAAFLRFAGAVSGVNGAVGRHH